jgi:carbon-monoxide dehydrogenase large subunit
VEVKLLRSIGLPIERLEDARLLTGKGRYVDDMHLDGLLHAVIVRSSIPHGTVRGIDVEEARAMPGVHAVYTAQDVLAKNGSIPKIPVRLSPLPEMIPFGQGIIAHDKVRYVGEPLAIVIADTPAQAEDAADRVNADIDSLAVVADCQASLRSEALLFEDTGTNVGMQYTGRKGSDDVVHGPYVRKEKFSVQRHSAVTLEPRGLVAKWDGSRQRLTVFGAAKVPFFTRKTLAAAMELPLESVDMIEVDVGGGFGVRGEFYPEDFLVPFAARRLDRPVKWIEDRRENLLSSNHSREMQCELEIVCEKDGRVLALRGEVFVDAGAYMRTSVAIPPRNVLLFLAGPYNIPSLQLRSSVCLTNKGPIGTYRGPGRFEADFFRERLFDMAARDLGIDPVEFRRKNLVRADQMPYPLAVVDKPARDEKLDSGNYQIALDRCLAEFGWNEKLSLQGKLIDGKYHGIALGCFLEGGAVGPKETARIEIEEDGGVTVYVGSSAVGQGLVTVLTQIAADALQVPMQRIRLLHGSTTYLKEGFGSFGSRSTVMGGCAILATAETLRTNIAHAAAARWGCDPGEVSIGPDLTVSYSKQTLTRRELGSMKLRAEGEFANKLHTYSYGTAAAHVTVDPGTGKVAVVDYFNVEDIGRIINPLTAEGQAVGAVVQGLGGALMEHLAYDENGQFLVGSLADYLMPTAADFPRIRDLALENSPSPNNPLGAKGGGEGATIPVGGVIANAVAAALSSLQVEPRSLPLTPAKVWALIQAARR